MDRDRPTTDQVGPLIVALYRRPGGSVGCCLHCVVDDGNFDHASVASALAAADEKGHADCAAIARLMLRMSRTQRAKSSDYIYRGLHLRPNPLDNRPPAG